MPLYNPPGTGSGLAAASTTEQLTGTESGKAATPDSVAALWEKGANIASAATLSIGEGAVFHVTGSTQIDDIDFATPKNGRSAVLIFDDGGLTLSAGAALDLMGGNIVTIAGDRACFAQDDNDEVICLWYQRAADTPGAYLSNGNSLQQGYFGGVSLTDLGFDHRLHVVATGEDLSADRTLTLIVSDANRTLTISGNADISGTNTGDNAANTSCLSSSTTSTQTGYFGDIKLKDDTNPSHYLAITVGEDLSADRTLTIVSGNADRTLTLGGNATLNGGTHSGTNTGDEVAASDTAAGKIEIAVQAEMETGTDTTRAVVPGRQQYHASACKAWADIDGASTTPNASYNVATVSNDVGETAVAVDVDFSGVNYAIVASVERNNSTTTVTNAKSVVIKNATQAATGFTLQCWDATATNNVIEDPTSFYVACFGDQ